MGSDAVISTMRKVDRGLRCFWDCNPEPNIGHVVEQIIRRLQVGEFFSDTLGGVLHSIKKAFDGSGYESVVEMAAEHVRSHCCTRHASSIVCHEQPNHDLPHVGVCKKENADGCDGKKVQWSHTYDDLRTVNDGSFVPWQVCEGCRRYVEEDGSCGCGAEDW